MGVGLIARDHTGKVRASMCTTQPHISDPATAEVLSFCCTKRHGIMHGTGLSVDHYGRRRDGDRLGTKER